MRLHGRNAAQWWHHDEAEDRYNYLYSAESCGSPRRRARPSIVKKAYLFLNNHFAAKSVVNAVMLKHLTGSRSKASIRRRCVERYPELAGLVDVAPVHGFTDIFRMTSPTRSAR